MSYYLEKRRENLIKEEKKDFWYYGNIISSGILAFLVFLMAFLYLLPGDIKAPKFWKEPEVMEVNYMPLFEEFMREITESMNEHVKNEYVKSLILENKVSAIYRDIDYYYYKELIPREYLEVFLLSTVDFKEIRSIIYSMMVVESGNFTKYIATNNNGTTDHGPLMLNSSNIDNKYFKDLYFPSENFINNLKESDINDIYISYIPACVNLLTHHLRVYDGDIRKSLKAYNGGPRVNLVIYKNTRLNRKTEAYYRKVRNIYYKNNEKHKSFIDNFNRNNFEIVCINEVKNMIYNDNEIRLASR